jgi:hypothetical protein
VNRFHYYDDGLDRVRANEKARAGGGSIPCMDAEPEHD